MSTVSTVNTYTNHTYQGHGDGRVTVDGLRLRQCQAVVNHSPDGFAWGYLGSGPAQLALAIMVNEYGEDLASHPIHYQMFKEAHVAKWPQGLGFSFTSEEIRRWVNELVKKEKLS